MENLKDYIVMMVLIAPYIIYVLPIVYLLKIESKVMSTDIYVRVLGQRKYEFIYFYMLYAIAYFIFILVAVQIHIPYIKYIKSIY